MRAIVVLLISALLTFAGAQSASAERKVTFDGSGDVWASESSDEWASTDWAPNVDVRRTVMDHQRDLVYWRANYVNLRDWVSEEIQLNVEVRTDGGGRFEAVIFIFWDGHSAGGYLADADGLPVRCRAMRSGTSFSKNTVWLNIPRECLGNPKWVGYRAYASSFDADFVYYYRDVVPGSGHELEGWSERVRRG